MIPKQLKNLKFCRIKRGTKKPFEKDWTNKPYSYKDIMKFLPKENYGVLCGYEDLAVIDCDVEAMQVSIESMFPKTYRVKTANGFHNYFFIPDLKQKIILETTNGTHLGEVQSHGTQVVGVNSIHPSGKKYEELNQEKIAKISCELLLDVLKGFMKETKETEENVQWERKEHSEVDDLSVASIWGTMGMKKHGGEYYGEHPIHGSEGGMNFWINLLKNSWHCFRCNSGGGVLSAIGVKEGVINCSDAKRGYLRGEKAVQCLEIAREKYGLKRNYEEEKRMRELKILAKKVGGELKEENIPELETYDFQELMKYEPEPQDWLIEGIIPKKEVGLLVGKRGERKTFTALHFALCLASGNKAFDLDKVPEKKKVLIIDEETGKNAMAQRMKAMAKAQTLEESPLEIKFFSFAGLKLDKKDTKRYLKFTKVIKDFIPDLIIIDCLQRCVTFEVDKDNAAISELFTDVVRPITNAYGTTWIFIHHMRKSPTSNYKPEDPLDEVRGGSELVNYCRFVLMCQAPKGQQRTEDGGELMVFRVLKMSNAPIQEPKVISFTNNPPEHLKIAYEGIPADVLAGEIQAAKAIKEWLFNQQMTGEFKTKDITNNAEKIGFKSSLLSQGLSVLLKEGFLNKIKRGIWRVSSDEIDQEKL